MKHPEHQGHRISLPRKIARGISALAIMAGVAQPTYAQVVPLSPDIRGGSPIGPYGRPGLIRTPNCTGQLVGKHAMLIARHCVGPYVKGTTSDPNVYSSYLPGYPTDPESNIPQNVPIMYTELRYLQGESIGGEDVALARSVDPASDTVMGGRDFPAMDESPIQDGESVWGYGFGSIPSGGAATMYTGTLHSCVVGGRQAYSVSPISDGVAVPGDSGGPMVNTLSGAIRGVASGINSDCPGRVVYATLSDPRIAPLVPYWRSIRDLPSPIPHHPITSRHALLFYGTGLFPYPGENMATHIPIDLGRGITETTHIVSSYPRIDTRVTPDMHLVAMTVTMHMSHTTPTTECLQLSLKHGPYSEYSQLQSEKDTYTMTTIYPAGTVPSTSYSEMSPDIELKRDISRSPCKAGLQGFVYINPKKVAYEISSNDGTFVWHGSTAHLNSPKPIRDMNEVAFIAAQVPDDLLRTYIPMTMNVYDGK